MEFEPGFTGLTAFECDVPEVSLQGGQLWGLIMETHHAVSEFLGCQVAVWSSAWEAPTQFDLWHRRPPFIHRVIEKSLYIV